MMTNQSNPALEDAGTDMDGVNMVDDSGLQFSDHATCVSEAIGTGDDVYASAFSAWKY